MDHPPLVMIAGFLASAGPRYWGPIEQFTPAGASAPRRIITLDVGAVASAHDRACEMYYQLKGGRVDYGQEHAEEHGHPRYGKTYPGLYPEWSSDKPIHLLGHSFGSCTIWAFQHLLAIPGFFPDVASPDQCLSLTSVSGAFHGTTTYHITGGPTDDAGGVALFSLGFFLHRAILLLSWLSPKLSADFGASPWGIRRLSISELSSRIFRGGCPWGEGRDNAGYDTSPSAAQHANRVRREYPRTYYRSYVTTLRPTLREYLGAPGCWRRWIELPFLLPMSFLSWRIRSFPLASIARYLPKHTLHSPEWRLNDGLIPVISQMHPGTCLENRCRHLNTADTPISKDSILPAPVPGKWDVVHAPGDHASTVPYRPPWGTEAWHVFFPDYFNYLLDVDHLYYASRPSAPSGKSTSSVIPQSIPQSTVVSV